MPKYINIDECLKKYHDFLNYEYNSESITLKTRDEYKIKSLDFMSYQKDILDNINQIDHKSIMDYLSHKGNKSSTKRTSFEIIKHLLKFIEEEENISFDLSKVKLPKLKKKPPQYLTKTEILEIFKIPAFNKPWYGDRNRFLFLLLVNSGLRVSEVINIKISDINRDDNFISTCGKGGKVRFVYYPNSIGFNSQFDRWMSIIPKSDYLICTKKGRKMTSRNVQKIIRSIFDNAGVSKNLIRTTLGPHLLRHTFATNLVNENVSMGIIQELLGHSDISTTTKYAHVKKDSLTKIVSDFETS